MNFYNSPFLCERPCNLNEFFRWRSALVTVGKAERKPERSLIKGFFYEILYFFYFVFFEPADFISHDSPLQSPVSHKHSEVRTDFVFLDLIKKFLDARPIDVQIRKIGPLLDCLYCKRRRQGRQRCPAIASDHRCNALHHHALLCRVFKNRKARIRVIRHINKAGGDVFSNGVNDDSRIGLFPEIPDCPNLLLFNPDVRGDKFFAGSVNEPACAYDDVVCHTKSIPYRKRKIPPLSEGF